MARKIDLVSGLADQAARSVTRDADSWKRYLDTASRLYKYSFDDQLLIYAQRPDATACASMELWNNRMRRWVKGGSKGIALIRHMDGGKPYLDYVFDVTDTRPVQGAGMPYLWRMGEGHRPAVLKALEEKYGKCGSRDTGKCLMEAAARAAQAAAPGYLQDLSYDRGDGTRQGGNGGAAEARFTAVLCASVQYSVLARCGLKASDYMDDAGLAQVRAFSEPAALHHLGNAVSAVSMDILQEIGRAVRDQDREMAEKLREFQADREKQGRKEPGGGKRKKTLENDGPAVYTGVTGEFNALKRENTERSGNNGRTGVQAMRGIPDPRPGTGRGEGDGGNAAGEIRDAETKLPDGAPQGDVHLHAADGEAPAAPAGDRQAGPGAGGTDRGGDDGGERGGRSPEGERPDGLGAGGKPFYGAGGGDGAAGDRVQLGQGAGTGEGAEDRVRPGREAEAGRGQDAGAERGAADRQQEPPKAVGKFHMEERETAGQDPAVSASVSLPGMEAAGIPAAGEDTGMEDGQDPHFPTVAGQIGHIARAQEAGQAEKSRALSVTTAAEVPEEVKQLALQVYRFYFHDPNASRKGERIWDTGAAERDYLPMLKDPKYKTLLYQDMVETFAAVSPEDGRSYQTMKTAVEAMGAFIRGEYSLFTPLPEAELQRQRMERLALKKAQREKNAQPHPTDTEPAGGAGEEKEPAGKAVERASGNREKGKPAGELEAAARALERKQKRETKEDMDGQLSFDFDSSGVPHMGAGQEREAGKVPETGQGTGTGEATVQEPAARTEPGSLAGKAPETVTVQPDVKDADAAAVPETGVAEGAAVVSGTGSEMGLAAVAGTETVADASTMPETGLEADIAAVPDTEPEAGTAAVPETGAATDAADLPDRIPKQEPHPAAEAQENPGEKPDIAQKKTAAALYRETLEELVETVRHSSLYPYLRDRDTAYDEAAAELDDTLGHFLDSIEDSRPELYHAFLTLPGFREWMVGDILERTYQDVVTDTRDAVARHAGEPDAPEWVQEEKRGQEKQKPVQGQQSRQAAGAAPYIEKEALGNGGLKSGNVGIGDGAGITERQGTDGPAAPDSADLEEAKQLIDAFCHDEYDAEPVDFSSLEHIGLAWTVIEDEKREINITAEADLLHPAVSRFVDDVCVERQEYGSLKELIDRELAVLDYAELLRLDNIAPEVLLEAGIPEGQLPELTGVMTPADGMQQWESGTGQQGAGVQQRESDTQQQEAGIPEPAPQDAIPREAAEIEGGQVVTAGPMTVYSTGLPYDIAIQKLHTGPDRHNFRITDENLGAGGQKTKFQNNLAAVRTLKRVEAENRLATPEEQETLSRYVGWGGLSQAFDPANEKWAKEYAQLKEALTPEEYASARGSVLNAHYTSPLVASAVYKALGRMDFTPGNILEPSCGTGNFFGLLPEGYSASKLYGVELDSLTGRIAGQLYQKADITVDGFEHTGYQDDFFDLAIGNVPFGEYKVHDRRYDRQNLLIHDYFLTKALDKVRPGGILAFITSKGTMDKADSSAREGLARKADLLGAIRLPNNAFLENAGTSVTADILFFQKRGSVPEKLPDWVHTGRTADGVPLNNYFLQNPGMVLGKMEFASSMYGNETETACLPFPDSSLKGLLGEAVSKIALPDRELLQMDAPAREGREETAEIPADPDVRNFSFTEKNGRFYFRENSRMKPVALKGLPAARARGMTAIRDSARRLIDLQLNGAGDAEVEKEQANLNILYDAFRGKYGLLNSPGNRQVFRDDASYPLLSSLEVLDGEGNFKCKADMFNKRTIRHRSPVGSVDTAVEALGVSIGERACVDLRFMASLMGGSDKIPQIVSDLQGIIFKDPGTGPFDRKMQDGGWDKGWQAADEYLSGNVRQKLERARAAAEKYPEFAVNVEALEKVQPKDLSAAEISVRIGAPWIDTEYYGQFLAELLKARPMPGRHGGKPRVLYSEATGEWRVKTDGVSVSSTDTRVWSTYGTVRMGAYEIFEHTLNQRSIQIYDYKTNEEGNEVRVLNGKQTAIAQQKQEAIKGAFQDWVFKDPQRRSGLCATYNRLFNSIRPREYDGRHIVFSGMNPEIRLETHQRDAVARMLYGKNTLLAHVVGAGKTYEMAAAAMEAKRLGLCRKSMFVVPNHLTEQWGSEFLTLYPGAKVLVASRKDFEPRNRKRFCARIATGDFDAVIIGHSQFEKIPLSAGRQEAVIREQIDEVVDAIAEAKAEKAERFTVKQMERMRKSLEARLQKLHDKKKDDTVTFEELGIDRLFVDEAHSFKNLFLHTKMRNVAGISQTDAQKSSDMFAKCRYMDEITGGRGIVFATGTPISNSVAELYTMMRYLQYDMLEAGITDSSGERRSLRHFDNWAATFGEQVAAVELKPEGTGFRLKTRFSRFYNLPELMNLWKEAADIQTAEMLKLPVPEAEYITIQTESSAAQKEMVQELARRAERIRKERLDPAIDNMLKVTCDGRKLALDQRLMNPLLPDDPGSKVNACVDNVFRIWQETAGTRGTQLIFSDLSTPKGRPGAEKEKQDADADMLQTNREATGLPEQESLMESSVYEDIRRKLVAKGIPAEEIAFIHSANTETQKAELFAKVRDGRVRVLLGSTQKMGAGTNVQTKLVASHDLDCPWRPADLEQRAGRIVRRGNENSHVWIYRYVTKGTFDAYTWGLVESKQRFIGQVMTGKSPVRSIEDVDATTLSYAEVKMLATGDLRIKEKMDLDIQVSRLKMLKADHLSQQYELQDRVRGYYPNKIKEIQLYIECLERDLPVLEAHPAREDAFAMTVMGTAYTDRKEAGRAIIAACRLIDEPGKEIELGEYRGFPMKASFSAAKFHVTMKRHLTYTAELSDDGVGNIARINNALERMPQSLEAHREDLARLRGEMEGAKEEMGKPFPQERELAEKSARLAELNAVLDQEEKDGGEEQEEDGKAQEEHRTAREEHGEAQGKKQETQDSQRNPGGKPSILKALKEYEPPAPAGRGMGRKTEREAAV